MASGCCVGQRPDFSVNCDIFKWLYLAYFESIYTKLGDFVKLGLHFMTMWTNSF